MPIPPAVSKVWPSDRALLLVHGVGDYKPGDYADLITKLQDALGPALWDQYAVYELFYDGLNDWMADKIQVSQLVTSAVAHLKAGFGSDDLGKAAAETCGDVIWPVLSLAARDAVREFYLAQVKQIVDDGFQAGFALDQQRITILCHSLGCFHTFEALHEAAKEKRHKLGPASPGVRFENVIFMASPVALIRSVAGALGPLVPGRGDLAALDDAGLSQPSQRSWFGWKVAAAKRWVSITGDLDPVGGHLFHQKLAWAYMNVDGQESFIDDQSALGIPTREALAGLLSATLTGSPRPNLAITNPHAWTGYVERNAGRIHQWLA